MNDKQARLELAIHLYARRYRLSITVVRRSAVLTRAALAEYYADRPYLKAEYN